ncbi:helix-turn-helix transcriptional regulator [Parasedimentitalea psychrophila]|nr:helix-turn-helix domain-containing protein [Parasedimentitalea psychrophila]
MHEMVQNQKTNQAALDYLDGFIDETRAADFLCQSVRTLQKWRVTGFGPSFYKPGRSVRYRRRDLRDWAESRRRKSTSQH